MQVLWDRSRATVGEVVEHIEGATRPVYNTVLTMLRILERKGYVGHEKDGRAFVYIPLVDRNQARKSALSQLLSKLFDDSPETLVLNLLGRERIDPDELGRMRELIDRASRAPRDRKNARKKAR